MSTPKFRRQFDDTYTGWPGIENHEPSVVVPDMSLTIKQLLINHTRGLHSDVTHNEGHYFETEIPVFTDLNDIMEYKEALVERTKEVEAIAREEKKKAKEAREAAKKKAEEDKALNLEKPPQKEDKPPETAE